MTIVIVSVMLEQVKQVRPVSQVLHLIKVPIRWLMFYTHFIPYTVCFELELTKLFVCQNI